MNVIIVNKDDIVLEVLLYQLYVEQESIVKPKQMNKLIVVLASIIQLRVSDNV